MKLEHAMPSSLSTFDIHLSRNLHDSELIETGRSTKYQKPIDKLDMKFLIF